MKRNHSVAGGDLPASLPSQSSGLRDACGEEISARIVLAFWRGGQGEQEAAALAGRAFGPDAAAVLLDDAAAEGQAQAGAAHGAGVGSVSLLEAVEDMFQFLCGDAAALVLDDETDFIFAG